MDSYSYIQEQSEDGVEYQFISEVTNRIYYVGFDPGFYVEFSDVFPALLANGVAFSIFSVPFDGQIEDSVRIGKDDRVKSTIIEIARAYLLEQQKDTVLVYQCDSHDGMQASRSYLFERWFAESAGTDMIKSDAEFEITKEGTSITHYLGYVISKENPNAGSVHEEFKIFYLSKLLTNQ